MAGNRAGGIKTREKMYAERGRDFYREIGRKGGRNGHTGGFASTCKGSDGKTGIERAKDAGAKGGRLSRRGRSSYTVERVSKKLEKCRTPESLQEKADRLFADARNEGERRAVDKAFARRRKEMSQNWVRRWN